MWVKLLGLLLFACQIIPNGSSAILGNRNPVKAGRPHPLPEGYVAFPEDQVAYKFHKTPRTWDDARERCIAEGARLAIADTLDKVVHINSLKNETTWRWVHVGFRRSNVTDEWIRVDNGLPVTYLPWKLGSPRIYQDCVGISFYYDALVNYVCDLTREYYACEISMQED